MKAWPAAAVYPLPLVSTLIEVTVPGPATMAPIVDVAVAGVADVPAPVPMLTDGADV